MISVTHVINGLGVGGAEMGLVRLLETADRSAFRHEVVSLTTEGPLGPRIVELGVPLTALGLTGTAGAPAAVARLAQRLRRRRPDLVHTWMYQADLVGGLAARAAAVPTVVWSVHQSDLSWEANTRVTAATMRVGARLSSLVPATIVSCCESGAVEHARLGYAEPKLRVIPYGFELPELDPAVRLTFRKELDLPEDTVLIGRAGRFHPMKDHRSFVHAAAMVRARHPEVAFVMCGTGMTWDNHELAGWARQAGLDQDVLHLLGVRSDMTRVFEALDIACSSSSKSEGLPNVIGEAMSVGVPVVTTDVGDSALMVDGTGRVVPIQDHRALAAALDELVQAGPAERLRLGAAARARVEERFSLPVMQRAWSSLYTELVGAEPAQRDRRVDGARA